MDRTNVTSSGYTFNGQNFTNETRTDSQGNNYTVAVPSTISTASLGAPASTLPITSPVYNTSGQQSLASQAGAYVNTATTAAEQALQAEQKALQASQTDVGRLLTDAGNRGTDLAAQYNQQDATGQSVNSLAAKLRQLSARSNALSIDNLAKSEAEINKATGQNITSTAVRRNTADATRENLINQASIAMEAAIVNADYQSAKSYADQMVDAKYDKLEADTKAALFNLENNKERFTAAEKKVAEATAARLRKEEADIETKKEEEKNIQNVGLTLRKYGADDKIVSEVLNAKSFNEAILKAGSSLQDPKAKLELREIKANIALKEAQARKAEREAILTKEPSAKEKAAAALAITQAKSSAQAAQDKIEAVDSILSKKAGISSRVGTNIFSRGIFGPALGGAALGAGLGPVGAAVGGLAGGVVGIKSAVTGEGQQVSGAVHQLTSGLTLQALIDAKKNGATFGALTQEELRLLAASATKLNDWELRDSNDKPTGYWNIDEKSFNEEVKNIQNLSRKALLQSQGTLITEDESSLLDSTFQEDEPTANEYYQ